MLSSIFIKNFRNISSLDLELREKAVNLLIGPNGSGKTSILEAIYFLSKGKSFRVKHIKTMIQYGSDHFMLVAQMNLDNIRTLGVKRTQEGLRTIKIDGIIHHHQEALARHLPVKIIYPEDVKVLISSHKERIKMIDWGVFYQNPHFYQELSIYNNLLSSRNAAIKMNYNNKYFSSLNVSLAKYAHFIDTKRQEYCQLFFQQLQLLCSEVFSMPIDCQYFKGWPDNRDLNQLLNEQLLIPDKKSKPLLYGAHKADLKFFCGSYSTNIYESLSRGQLKTFFIIAKIVQGNIFNQISGKPCLYLIDDLQSELDDQHIAIILQKLNMIKSQIILTSVDGPRIQTILCALQIPFQEHKLI